MRVSPQRRPLFTWWTASIDMVVAFVVFLLVWALVGASLTATTSSQYPPTGPSSGAIRSYWVTAAVLFALVILGFLVALSQKRTPAVIAYPLVALLLLAIVLVLSVPRISWDWTKETYRDNPYSCSRTDSENCQGG